MIIHGLTLALKDRLMGTSLYERVTIEDFFPVYALVFPKVDVSVSGLDFGGRSTTFASFHV